MECSPATKSAEAAHKLQAARDKELGDSERLQETAHAAEAYALAGDIDARVGGGPQGQDVPAGK